MNLPPVILASASPRRQDLLRRAGLACTVVPADVTERVDETLSGRELALLNAHRKARAVARRFPDHLVLAADTVVCRDAVVYGKPRDLADAARMLGELQGRIHQVITGVALVQVCVGKELLFAEITDVTFRPLTRTGIEAYLAAVNPFDKAGAYAIQERGEAIVAGLDGSFTNVVGLPVERLQAELARWQGLPSAGGRLSFARMSKVKRLLHTRYRVNDLERSVRFYREVLGLREVRRHKSPRGSELVFLKAPASEELLELCSFADSGPVVVQRDLTHLAFEVDSLAEFGRHLARLGLAYTDGPQMQDDGSGFAFIDAPEGYDIELMQRATQFLIAGEPPQPAEV